MKLAGLAAILAPAGIILHEFGHYIVGLSLGYPVHFGVASVSGGPQLGTASDLPVVIQAMAGPIVTVVLIIVAAIALSRDRGSLWALALAITAPLRFLVGASFLFFVGRGWLQGRPFAGSPNFDEYNAASALGWSPVWLISAQMAALICFWAWSLTRPKRGRRLLSLGSALIGAAIGVSAWMTIIGPALIGR